VEVNVFISAFCPDEACGLFNSCEQMVIIHLMRMLSWIYLMQILANGEPHK
jgi:hypothetical protein